MAKSNLIRVSLVGDAKALLNTFRDAEAGADKWSRNMGNLGKSWTTTVTAPIIAGAGLAVKAAAEEEQQMATLADVIEQRIPGATQAMIDKNEEWVTSVQNSTGIADSEIRAMEQAFISSGMSMEEAQKNVALALDVSAATGKDAAAVQSALIKASQGNTGALKKLGIEVKNADGSAKSFNQIQKELSETMGGTAAAAADTAAGRMEIMKLKFADIQETLGNVLLPILEKFVGWLTKVADWFNNLSPAGQKMIVVVLGVVAAIGPVLIIMSKLVKAFGIVGKAWGILSKAFMANPWLLLIAAIIALVVLIVANWDKIKKFILDAWDKIKAFTIDKWNAIKDWLSGLWTKIKDAVGNAWKWVQDKIKAAADFVLNLFKNWTLVGLIIKHWDKIKEGVSNVKDWIIDKWNAVIDFFRGIPGRISSALGNMWDGVKTAFRTAINWIIGKWNGLSISIGGGTILGVDIPKITVSTPNIPYFHQGGIFHASRPGGEGLAVLKDGERVLRPGQSQGGLTVIQNFQVPPGADMVAVGRAAYQGLQALVRAEGQTGLQRLVGV